MNAKSVVLVSIGLVVFGAFALDNVEVTNVVARQRYPWNGLVDIDYKLDSKATEAYQMQVEVIDNIGKTNLPVKSVCVPGVSAESNPCTVSKATSRIVWDAAKDLPNGYKCSDVSVICRDARTVPVSNLYCVVTLATGEIEYFDSIPKGGWTDEYKTQKMVFRRIDAGSFMMGTPNESYRKVTLTKPYYVAVYEFTEGQYDAIKGTEGYSRQPKLLTYKDVRGFDMSDLSTGNTFTCGATAYAWPMSSDVEPSSIIGVLRNKTGLQDLDLLTEAEWEYACRAETTTILSSGGSTSSSMREIGRFEENAFDGRGDASSHRTTVVGTYEPNAWGIYDMHGNAREWCLDVWSEDLGTVDVEDPKGMAGLAVGRGLYGERPEYDGSYAYYSQRVVRGGGYYRWAYWQYSEQWNNKEEDRADAAFSSCCSASRTYGRVHFAIGSIAYRKEYTFEGVRMKFYAK